MVQKYNKSPTYKHKYQEIFIDKKACNTLCYTLLVIIDKRLFYRRYFTSSKIECAGKYSGTLFLALVARRGIEPLFKV